ncbi:MAG: T9SS C-terminal target domain-containing protein [Candidatus Kapaibacterium sp.]|nr:MAG: T9SS C-terminal target domain-containing protein [Candidatus Kapabacteria bacterium]
MRRYATIFILALVFACFGAAFVQPAFAQPTNVILVNNTADAPLSTIQLGTTYSIRWNIAMSPVGTQYRVDFSANGGTSWETIQVRNTSTQRLENLVVTDSGSVSPGAGARFGRGISRLLFRAPRESQNARVRLVQTTDSTRFGVTGAITVLPPAPPITVDSTLRGAIPAGTTITLSNRKIYGLDGYVFVDSGAVVRIEAGTVVVGDTAGQNSALCVNRGGILFARGTAQSPIVLTSRSSQGQRRAGDWGGLLIAGRARTNQSGNLLAFEGGIADENRVRGWYGGGATPDDNDSSGVIEYVRVEFGGIAAFPNEELNGITLGAVGRRTVFRYVQSSFANDDGIEWFGGSVDGKWLISQNAVDDDFDTDFGFSGRIQYGLIIRGAQIADQSTSQAFESDNDANGTFNQPFTSAIFSNITAIGPLSDTAQAVGQWNTLFGSAAQIRRNSRQSIVNSLFIGWPRAGFELQGARTGAAALADSLLVRNNRWYGVKGATLITPGGTTPEPIPAALTAAWFTATERNNLVTNQLGSVQNYDEVNRAFESPSRFDPRPVANASFLASASFTRPASSIVGIDDAFFTRVPFQGAFNTGTDAITNRWDLPWAEYDPNSFPYAAAQPTSRNTFVSVRSSNTLDYNALSLTTFPIPANDAVTVRYNLPSSGKVTVRVTNILGASVLDVANDVAQNAGVYEFNLNTSNLAPGSYFVNVMTERGTTSQKITVVR